ncbi:MAG: hypothetical protein HQL75_02360 [Magnetococcales bacterium]|nr:hypothetical protein [Magnetococcales bacterium]
MNHNHSESNPVALPSAKSNPRSNPEWSHKVASSPMWDEKVTEKEFYEKVLPFDNTEVDMYEVPPARAKIRPPA